MRDIELIQAHREPDYPEFRERVSYHTLKLLRDRLQKNGEALLLILSPPWQKLVYKIMTADRNDIQVSQRDASLLINELRIP